MKCDLLRFSHLTLTSLPYNINMNLLFNYDIGNIKNCKSKFL